MNFKAFTFSLLFVFTGCILLSNNLGFTDEKSKSVSQGEQFCYNRYGLWLPLPDFVPFPGGITDTINVPLDSFGEEVSPEGSFLVGVQVIIDTLIHTWLGDLVMTIEHDGILDTFTSRPGAGIFGSSADIFINARLTDSAIVPIESIPNSPNTVTGDFLPGGSSGVDSLKKFNFSNWPGNWILRASDNAADDTGSLRAWSLCLFIEFGNIIISSNGTPTRYSLHQNFPNPFNPSTKIGLSIPKMDEVSIIVYDVNGREVETIVNEILNPGEYNFEFDASKLPSGTYFYRMKAGNYFEVRKMVILK